MKMQWNDCTVIDGGNEANDESPALIVLHLKLQIARMELELQKSRESQQRVENENERLNQRVEELENDRAEKERKIEELQQRVQIMERKQDDNMLKIGKCRGWID